MKNFTQKNTLMSDTYIFQVIRLHEFYDHNIIYKKNVDF